MSDLEHTATSPQGASPTAPLRAGTVLDHYVIERELGSGGMGIVYAAFDTELQRRVALKVLREGLTDQAQQRLLREARAMAKLTHPNVVTVYEVQSASGRDFVAMELVDGEPLVDWLRAERRAERDIIDAFVAAGHGLAAAHAAGIVHRDFKPHNVLRSRGGRVVVTDFGLARDATDPLATTMPVDASGPSTETSALSGLTVPGSVLGTPAYMAPEQWSGGRVTPATDQFAFCVALWEALDGERPYRGPTLDALRAQVTEGPESLDASKLPRRLRGVLRRGLATNPDERWATMAALLARLVPRTRRITVTLIGSAAVVAAAVVFAIARGNPDARSCRAPAFDLAKIPATQALAAWRVERELACAAPPTVRDKRLACLDRVLARLDASARARQLSPALAVEAFPVDPSTCARERPPALPARYSDDAVAAATVAAGGTVPTAAIDHVRANASADSCAAAYLALVDVRLDDAARDAAKCGDDVAFAEAELRGLERDTQDLAEGELAKRVRDVETALDRAARRDHGWRIERVKAEWSWRHRRYADAIASYEAAISAAPQARAVEVAANKLDLLLDRGWREDLERVREDAATWIPIAKQLGNPQTADELAWMEATARWGLGDIASAGDALRALHAKGLPNIPGGIAMSGTVVDTRGAPVAGATVATGFAVIGDAKSIVTPLHGARGTLRMVEIATTDAQGRYTFEQAPRCYGAVIAQRGTERSLPVEARDGARLVVRPTTRVRGRVDIAGRIGMFAVSVAHASNAFVAGANVMTMVDPDGTFEVDGVVPGPVVIGLGEGTRNMAGHAAMKRMEVGPRGLDGVVLEMPAGRELRLLIRGDELMAQAPVFVVDGTVEAKTMTELVRRLGEHQLATAATNPIAETPPAEIAAHYKPGDRFAKFASAPTGPATACVLRAMKACGEEMRVLCVPVPANAALITIEAKP